MKTLKNKKLLQTRKLEITFINYFKLCNFHEGNNIGFKAEVWYSAKSKLINKISYKDYFKNTYHTSLVANKKLYKKYPPKI